MGFCGRFDGRVFGSNCGCFLVVLITLYLWCGGPSICGRCIFGGNDGWVALVVAVQYGFATSLLEFPFRRQSALGLGNSSLKLVKHSQA